MKRKILYYKDLDTIKGEISFVEEDNYIIIDHTEVYPMYQGQGIARKLVEQAIEYAKNNNLKIKATCSYAVNFFNKNPNDIYIG